MHIRFRFYIIVLACLYFRPALAQQNVYDQLRQPIENWLETQFSTTFSVRKLVELDSVVWAEYHPQVERGVEDPYGNLSQKIFFAAVSQDSLDHSDYVVGLYGNNQVLWTTLPGNGLTCSIVDLFHISDLNIDGRIDFVVNCLTTGGAAFNNGSLWIYSWDESSVELISQQMADSSGSVLVSEYGLSFHFPDIDGDGVREIRAYNGLVGEEQEIVWSWNGQLYGAWLDTPATPLNAFYPANLAEAYVNAVVTPSNEGFEYAYTITSWATSKRRIAEFHIDHGQYDTTGAAPEGWSFYGGNSAQWLTWMHSHDDSKEVIKPGQVKNGFKVVSSGLPHIYSFFIRSEHELADGYIDRPYEERLLLERNNSFVGFTLAPRESPSPNDPLTYLDTLRTYPQRASAAAWITDSELAADLQGKYDLVRTMLAAGDLSDAVGLLSQIVTQVDMEYQGGHLSSEAYALLLWNTNFLLDSLPPDFSDLTDVAPILECVADNENGTFTAYFGYNNLSGTLGDVPYGGSNALTPSSYDGRQPVLFVMPEVVTGQPGRTPYYPNYAFSITFNTGEEVVWSLTGRTATASESSTRCPQ